MLIYSSSSKPPGRRRKVQASERQRYLAALGVRSLQLKTLSGSGSESAPLDEPPATSAAESLKALKAGLEDESVTIDQSSVDSEQTQDTVDYYRFDASPDSLEAIVALFSSPANALSAAIKKALSDTFERPVICGYPISQGGQAKSSGHVKALAEFVPAPTGVALGFGISSATDSSWLELPSLEKMVENQALKRQCWNKICDQLSRH